MPRAVFVRIDPSQFPENVRQDLLESLRSRQINHKFHYDSIKQTQKWLALHDVFSPSRTDADGAGVYDKSFAAATKRIGLPRIHVIGLGCGGGQKDKRLLQLAKLQGKEIFYTPSDVSVAMVLIAQQTARSVVAEKNCFPFVCDLAAAHDVSEIFSGVKDLRAARLLTFFGMIPNFEPQQILPVLADLLRPKDWMLLSANLAPGKNYLAGVKKILPLYDNELTRDWLQTFLFDLGVEKSDGVVRFDIEDCYTSLKRVVAHFIFSKRCQIHVAEERLEFFAGERIRLFFSYRHTPAKLSRFLHDYGITVVDQWITKSQEEGVFLCHKLR